MAKKMVCSSPDDSVWMYELRCVVDDVRHGTRSALVLSGMM